MEETAYAKLNLALHVRGREADGYHRIETLFAFCEDGDVLRVEQGEGLSLRVEGLFADALGAGDDNLVLRAAKALAQHCGVSRDAALTLDKSLPVASGIGGGSADAAAALRLLRRWWDVDPGQEALHAIARSLGADVPACLASTTQVGTGRGDSLAPAEAPSGMPVLLVNPGISVSTAEVFRRWDGIDRGPLGDDFRAARNDLEPPAFTIAPQIAEVLEALRAAPEPLLARMSGSGATCFALYEDEAARDAAAAGFAAAHPGWWQVQTRLR